MDQLGERAPHEVELEQGTSLTVHASESDEATAPSLVSAGVAATPQCQHERAARTAGLTLVLSLLVAAACFSPWRLATTRAAGSGHVVEQLWGYSWKTDTSEFQLTHQNYTDKNHLHACSAEFGSEYMIADWMRDIRTLSKDQVRSMCDTLQIMKTFNAGNFFVSSEGQNFYGSERAYFFERHDGHPPGNWLVHDMHGAVTLGSWFGIRGPVLCVKRSASPTSREGIVHHHVEEAAESTHSTTMLPFDAAAVKAAPSLIDTCGKIPATRVFDVQWSGNENKLSQDCSGFAAPFDPSSMRRLVVDRELDHFRLAKMPDGSVVLQHFDRFGKMKDQLSGGKVKLASSEVLFYIIDGWFGTIITKSDRYADGGSATFDGLTLDPALRDCRAAKSTHSTTMLPFDAAAVKAAPSLIDTCGKIPATRVFDVQWSGNENKLSQDCSGFAAPFDPSSMRRLDVDRELDHFRLAKMPDGSVALQHFDRFGKMKDQLSGGKVKLASSEVLFYIIDGWFGTIITKSDRYADGGSATFDGLTLDPALRDCRAAKSTHDTPGPDFTIFLQTR